MKTRASFWMMSAAVLALSACAGDGKGPGKIGTKSDITVVNHGLPNAPASSDVASGAASTDLLNAAETLSPNPAPAVAAGEPLSDPSSISSPVTEEQPLAASAPSVPMNDTTTATTAPVTDTAQIVSAPPPPPEAVQPPAVPASEPLVDEQAAVSPSVETSAQPPLPVENAAATPAPSPVYPASDYSAANLAPAASSSPSVQASLNFYDPAIITAAQSALKAKTGYRGKNDGVISTEFLNSLSEYQALNRLPQGGLNEPTLRALGIIE